jgi:8-oxo-dGTP diphosphatase
VTDRRAPDVVVGAVVLEDDHLLLVKRANPPAAGSWSVPGGRVEWGETLAEAVVRELAEETGLEGACGELVGWAQLISRRHHAVVFDFRVHLMEMGDPVAGDDAADARWVPLEDVSDWPLAPGLAEFLHDHGVIATIA